MKNIVSILTALAVLTLVALGSTPPKDILFVGKGAPSTTVAHDVNFLRQFIAHPPAQRLGFGKDSVLYYLTSDIVYPTGTENVDPAIFSSYKSVVIAGLAKTANPWTESEIQTAENYVAGGGVIVFLDNSAQILNGTNPNNGTFPLTTHFQQLLPAAGLRAVPLGSNLLVDNDSRRIPVKPSVTSHLIDHSFPWMRERFGLINIASLPSVKKLIYFSAGSATPTTNVLRHSLGNGQIYFMGAPVVAYNQADGLEYYALLIENAVFDAAINIPAAASTREKWILQPLGGEKPRPSNNLVAAWKPVVTNLQKSTPPASALETVIHENGSFKTVIVVPDSFHVRLDDPIPHAANDLRRVLERTAGTRSSLDDALAAKDYLGGNDTINNFGRFLDQPTGILIAKRSDVQFFDQDGLTYQVTYKAGTSAQRTFSHAILLGNHANTSPFLLGVDYDVEQPTFPEEGFHLKTHKNVLFVIGRYLGHPNGAKPFGVQHGVTRLLEEGIRPNDPKRNPTFLWPGELGTNISPITPLRIPPIDLKDAPFVSQRKIRNIDLDNEQEVKTSLRLIYSNYTSVLTDVAELPGDAPFTLHSKWVAMRDSQRAAAEWFNRAGLGGVIRFDTGHSFNSYFTQFGVSHPHWFASQPDGTRLQNSTRPRLDKNVPALLDYITASKVTPPAELANYQSLSISPNDGGYNSYDMSIPSRQKDPVNAPDVWLNYYLAGKKLHAKYPALTDRTVAFYNSIASRFDLAFPTSTRKLAGHAYQAYKPAPSVTPLNKRLLIVFAGPAYLNEGERQKDRVSWSGWSESVYHPDNYPAGANRDDRMILRPNAFWQGLGLPFLYTKKLKEDISYFAGSGLLAADFDGCINSWGSQGLNYYVTARLLWDPSKSVDGIVGNYCTRAFWYAGGAMKDYFLLLENLSDQLSLAVQNQADSITDRPADSSQIFLARAADYFNPTHLAPLRAKLDLATATINNHSSASASLKATISARIELHRKGLQYAEKTAEIYRLVNENAHHTAIRAALESRNELLRSWLQGENYIENSWAVGIAQTVYTEEWLYKQVGFKY